MGRRSFALHPSPFALKVLLGRPSPLSLTIPLPHGDETQYGREAHCETRGLDHTLAPVRLLDARNIGALYLGTGGARTLQARLVRV